MPFIRKMPEKYTVKDMPIPAQFMTTIDCPSLKLILKPLEDRYDENTKTYRQIEGSSVRVEFTNRVFVCENSEIFKLMVKHRAFRSSQYGFDIDKNDPTGFWRHAQVVEVEEVKIAKAVRRDVDIAKVNALAVSKKLSELTDTGKINEARANVEECEAALKAAEESGVAEDITKAKAALTRAKNKFESIEVMKIDPLLELKYESAQ